MKKRTPITLQDLIDFADKHKLPHDIPIGLGLCSSEHGDLCMGIIVDTPDETCQVDEYDEPIQTETTGEHCFFKDGSPLNELSDTPVEDRCILMLTDGYHYE